MTKRTPAPDPFNNPFGKVKLDGPKKAEPARPPPPPKAKPPADDDEAALFLQAMGEVVVKKPDRKRADDAPRVDPTKLAHEESESLLQLSELVAGDGPIGKDGAVPGLDPKILDRLRKGLFLIDATPGPGPADVLLMQARRDGHRCVRLAAPADFTKGRLAKIVLAACATADGGVDVLLRR